MGEVNTETVTLKDGRLAREMPFTHKAGIWLSDNNGADYWPIEPKDHALILETMAAHERTIAERDEEISLLRLTIENLAKYRGIGADTIAYAREQAESVKPYEPQK